MSRLIALLAAASLVQAADSPADFFESRVRPVLAKHCFACHTQTKMGGLEITSRDALLKGGTHGPAVVSGDPDGSLLIQAVRQSHEKLKMPPTGKLPANEIDDLTAWVKAGAVWPEHAAVKVEKGYRITPEQRAWWAFQPVRKPEPPPLKDASPIDAFLLSRLQEKGLRPNPPADRRTLLRRVYYDLIGLPPTQEQVDSFLADKRPDAFARVVDSLLASPHYGERWGRHWLDIARYSDDKLNPTQDEPYPHAYRYRDWVIQAFNSDLPYDRLIKAQIAGDLVDPERLAGGLGFYALSPEFQDDRVDATTKAFLAFTVGCAQCHDHKFDPIPTKDYYALQGVFSSTQAGEHPLAPEPVVKEYKARKAAVDAQKKEISDFADRQAKELAAIFAARTADYIRAVREETTPPGLDAETLERWKRYLAMPSREHPFLDKWKDASFAPAAFQEEVLALLKEKKKIDDTNFIRLGGSDVRRDLANADLLSLERDRFFLWRDLFSDSRFASFDSGILYYKEAKLDRFLDGQWKAHLTALRDELKVREKAVPEPYPFFHVIQDSAKPQDMKIRIRGSRDNLGEVAPRAFLSILSKGEPARFTKGSGRLELAEAIAAPDNPLTARVMVNRIWMTHFGSPIVATPNNFGRLGERPSHPELLDYLAARFVEQGWSIKALHREIVLSRTYAMSGRMNEKNFAADPDNRLYWRANRRRLDIEPLRDTLLAVTGDLDTAAGGKPAKLTEASNLRRTVYGFVSRRKLDGTLSLFDFPNPMSTSEQRIVTATPLQQLYFLNSSFVQDRAKSLAKRLADAAVDDAGRIRAAYKRLYQRAAAPEEVKLGLEYLKSEKDGWVKYAQALLGSNELLFVD